VWVGTELTKHICKTTAKCSCLCKDMAIGKFLLCFPRLL